MEQSEIKILKALVKAQDKMILHYRIGKPRMPEWVFDAMNRAKKFYGVDNIGQIFEAAEKAERK